MEKVVAFLTEKGYDPIPDNHHDFPHATGRDFKQTHGFRYLYIGSEKMMGRLVNLVFEITVSGIVHVHKYSTMSNPPYHYNFGKSFHYTTNDELFTHVVSNEAVARAAG